MRGPGELAYLAPFPLHVATMAQDLDPQFFDRADAVIRLANEQLADANRGQVSASSLYAASRFNAWVATSACPTVEDARRSRDEILEYFTRQYRAMLKENLDDYIENFHTYVKPIS